MACALSHMSSVLLVILTICFNHLNFSSENVKSKDWMELNRTLLKICILKIDGCKWWILLDDTSKLKHTWMPPDALQSAAICGAEEIWFLSIILQFPMMHKRQRCTLRFPAASLNNGMSCDKEETVLFSYFTQSIRMTKWLSKRPTKSKIDFIKLATSLRFSSRSVCIIILSSAHAVTFMNLYIYLNRIQFIFIEIYTEWNGKNSGGLHQFRLSCLILVSLRFCHSFAAAGQQRDNYIKLFSVPTIIWRWGTGGTWLYSDRRAACRLLSTARIRNGW